MSRVRAFIALPTPPSIKEQLRLLVSELKQLEADVKWDSSEKFHITLKFLGNVEAQLLENLIAAVHLIPQRQPFDLSYETLGAFPDLTNPRVIWVGTAQSNALRSLQQHVDDVCAQFGFHKEEREFHSHITLGRVKGSRNIHRLTDKLKSLTLEPITSRCTELLVMRSELRPSGSVYSVLKSIPLQS